MTATADSVDPKALLSGLAYSLDPLDAPELKGKNTATKKTTIQHIPASSLAQAFVEVFADLGKEHLGTDLSVMARAHLGGAATDDVVAPLAKEIAPDDEEERGKVAAAFATLLVGASGDGDLAAVATTLIEALRPIKGAAPPRSLTQTATAYAEAIRAHTDDAELQKRARDMAGPLARTFPERFTRQRIDDAVDSLDTAPLGPTTRRLWEAAEGRLDEFRTGLEGYFDGEMKRLSGYYKRSIRVVVIALAILVAIVCNVDAVSLARDLWRNPEGRAALVAEADSLTSSATTAPAAGGAGSPATTVPSRLARVQAECDAAAAKNDSSIANPDDAAKAFSDVRRCVNDALSGQAGLDVVDNALWVSPHSWWDQWFTGRGNWWLHFVGVTVTALALIVGAPFWFDILKRLTGVRRQLVGQT